MILNETYDEILERLDKYIVESAKKRLPSFKYFLKNVIKMN